MPKNKEFEYAVDGHINGIDKDIFDYMDSSAFKIHGIEMTCRDVIQAVVYMNYVLYETIQDTSSIFNLFAFEIDIDREVINCSGLHHAKLTSTVRGKNTIRYDLKKNIKTFYLSTGFMKDYFETKEPKQDLDFHKYVFDEGQVFRVSAQDFEDLIKVQKRK